MIKQFDQDQVDPIVSPAKQQKTTTEVALGAVTKPADPETSMAAEARVRTPVPTLLALVIAIADDEPIGETQAKPSDTTP